MAMRLTLRAIGIVGAVMFLSVFALTFAVPGWVEDFAADYIEAEARERIEQRIDSIRLPEDGSALSRLAESMLERNADRIEQLRAQLKNRVHEQWASALARVRDLDCECRREWEKWFEDSFRSELALLDAANAQISSFIHATYMDILTELRRDVRVFAGSNAAVFLLLLAVSFLKPQAIVHLFLPGTLLALSTVVCSYFYVFEQNWLLTIIFSDYLGFAYLGWLAVAFALLSDIVLNRARITTEILNGFFNAIGSAVSVGPC